MHTVTAADPSPVLLFFVVIEEQRRLLGLMFPQNQVSFL